jgi:hypothetical protein
MSQKMILSKNNDKSFRVETTLIEDMNTLQEIKKAGWAEVEKQQIEYSRLHNQQGGGVDPRVTELAGYIKGLVFILNMIK